MENEKEVNKEQNNTAPKTQNFPEESKQESKSVEIDKTNKGAQVQVNVDVNKAVTEKESTKKTKKKKPLIDKLALTFLIIGLVTLFIGFVPLVSLVFVILYYLILILIAFLTLFTLLLNENFKNLLTNANDITSFIGSLLPYSPYIIGATLPFFITSLVLFSLSKSRNKAVGIVFSSIFILVAVGGIVIFALQAQSQ